MTEQPNPKRRALTTTTPSYDRLPPDVIVSEILIHFMIGVDFLNELMRLNASQINFFCFGYFKRDLTRHLWAIFRSFIAMPPTDKLHGRYEHDIMLIPLSKMHSFAMPGGYMPYPCRVRRVKTVYALLPNVSMPLLKSVSNLVMRDINDVSKFRDLDTLILHTPIVSIPTWCVHLRVQSKNFCYHGQWPIPRSRRRMYRDINTIVDYLKPRWNAKHQSARSWMSKTLFTNYTPNLREVTLDGSDTLYRDYEKHFLSPTAWDLRNAPNLRKLWINYGLFAPTRKIFGGVVDFYDFLQPLSGGLDELKFGTVMRTPTRPRWYLPPVRKSLHVARFAVAPGYEIPSRATFIRCYFDPNHEYRLRQPQASADMNKSLYIERYPYLYLAEEDPKRRLPGRVCIKGNVNILCYVCPHILLDGMTSSEYRTPIGRPFEFVFTGNTKVASITSKLAGAHSKESYIRAHVALNGASGIVKVSECRALDLDILRCSEHLLIYDSKDTVITIAEECEPSVGICDCNRITLTAPRITNLMIPNQRYSPVIVVVNANIRNFRCCVVNGSITLNGAVNSAVVCASWARYTFGQVRFLTIRAGRATFEIQDPDKLERLTFESITMNYVENCAFYDMPRLRLPRHKVQFNNVPEDVMQVLLGKVVGSD